MTNHDIPVSLAVLWQRWQELDELPEHDKAIHAELAAMDKQIVEQPAENFSDLLAKLRFLAHQARDLEWDDRLEKLYASIEDGFRNQVGDRDNPLSRIEDELLKIPAVVTVHGQWSRSKAK